MKVRNASKQTLSVNNTIPEKFLQFFFNLFSNMGAIPYIVQSSETKDLVILPSKNVRYYVWVFAVVSAGAHFVKTTVSLSWMAEKYLKSGEIVKLAFHCFWVAADSIMVGIQIVFIVHKDDLVNLINGTVDLFKKLEKLLEPNLYERPRIIRTILLSFFCVNMISSTIVCGIPAFIFFREDVWHYGSNIYHPIKQLKFMYSEHLALVLGLLLDTWFIWASWGAALLNLYTLLLIIQTYMTSLRCIQRHHQGKGLLRLHSSVYPKMRILILLLNNSYNLCYYPVVKSVLGILTIQGICMAVGLAYLNSLILIAFGVGALVCCATALVIITSFTGIVHQESVNYSHYLRRNKLPDKMSMKVLKSIRIEGIKCGSFYVITKYTSLTLLGMVTNISGSLLISMKT